jgi:hypothetical protein
MAATTAEKRAWARDRGLNPPVKGALPKHILTAWDTAHAGPRVVPLPGPDDPELDNVEDIGELVPDDEPEDSGPDAPPAPSAEPPDAGPGPAHARKEWHRGPRPAKGKPPRITVGIRTDIQAKISFALMVPGQIWAARDPVCGGTFVQQIPETADAFADIVCDSADLVAFFAGPGGNFMKILKVGAALMPVMNAVMAHHVYHSVELAGEDAQQPDQQYAA